MADDGLIQRGRPASGTSPLRPVAPAKAQRLPSADVPPAALSPTQATFSAASRSGFLRLPSLDAARKAVDAALATDPVARRVEFLPHPGVPVRLELAGHPPVEVFWPYPEASRHGGPEQLAGAGSDHFRDHMAPFAAYFGAGTRGPTMAWLGDQASRGELPKGSPATQGLQAIANSLFWDVPMQQASDDRLIAKGLPADLSPPTAMAQYLRHQREAIAALLARQNPEVDGPAYVRAGRELFEMVDAALARSEAYLGGDRSPVRATPVGPYAWYDQASQPSGAVPLFPVDPQASPQQLRDLARRLEQDRPS